MEINSLFPRSRPVIINPYRAEWVLEFQEVAHRLRQTLGDFAIRIDHIGSTSVPDLAAKDIVDIQVTIKDLAEEQVPKVLNEAGFQVRPDIRNDVFIGMEETSPELQKRYAREWPGHRRTHIHIRENGRFNQRFPLLFRDYLRASEVSRKGYQLIKQRLATLFPQSIDGYLYIKDPVMDLIYEAAEHWAAKINWQPDNDFV